MFKRKTFSFRLVCSFLIVLFTNLTFSPLARAAGLNLPAPNQFIPLSQTCSFPLIRGLKLDPLDPFNVEFIVDTADKGKRTISKEEASSLIRYFLAGLTIPEKDIWVNLSPYEKNRIIPESTAATDLGKDLLSQDYILKQLLSSLTYPESTTGKEFWNKTYKEISKTADTNNLSVDTFNKIWIVPDEAVVRQNNNVALITKASLKALLEEDYLALGKAKSEVRISKSETNSNYQNQENTKIINKTALEVMKQTILPKINKDINQGKNFANLRQIYHSLILGIWFKKKFQDSIYKHYIDKGLVKGIDLKDKTVKDQIYNQYLKAFQKGIYDYIKSDPPTPRLRRAGYEPASNKQVKRRYYSGGFALTPGFSLASSSGISNPLDWMAVEQGISSPMARDSFMGNPLNIPTKIVGVDGEGKVLTIRPGKNSASSSIDNEPDRFPAHLPEQRIFMSRQERAPSIEAMITGMEEFFSEREKDEFSREVKAVEGTMIAAQKIKKGRYLLQCPLGDISLFLPSNSAELVFSIDSIDKASLRQLTLIFLRLLGHGYAQVTLDEDMFFPFMSMDNTNQDKLFELFGYHRGEGALYSNINGETYEEEEIEDKIAEYLTEEFPKVIEALNKLIELSIQASSAIMKVTLPTEIPLSRLKVTLGTKVEVKYIKEIGEQIQKNIREYFQNKSNKLVRRKPQSFVGGRTEPFTLVDLKDGCFSLRFGDGMSPRWVGWEWLKAEYFYPNAIITINAENEASKLKDIFISLTVLSMKQVANRRDEFFKPIEYLETETGIRGEKPVISKIESFKYNKIQEALKDLDKLVSSSSLNKEEPGIKQIDGGIALKDISSKFEAQEDSFVSSPVWNAFFEAGELKGFRFDIVAIEEIRDLEEVFKPALAKGTARLR